MERVHAVPVPLTGSHCHHQYMPGTEIRKRRALIFQTQSWDVGDRSGALWTICMCYLE